MWVLQILLSHFDHTVPSHFIPLSYQVQLWETSSSLRQLTVTYLIDLNTPKAITQVEKATRISQKTRIVQTLF